MLKKVVSTLLVTGVLAASIVAPAFAASKERPSPDLPEKNGNAMQSLPSSAVSNLTLGSDNFSKLGMGYIIFDFDNWYAGRHADGGL